MYFFGRWRGSLGGEVLCTLIGLPPLTREGPRSSPRLLKLTMPPWGRERFSLPCVRYNKEIKHRFARALASM